MGCGASADDKDHRAIEHEMKPTNVPKFDELFRNLSDILQKCEKLRHGFESAPEEAIEAAETDWLKDQSLDPFAEAVAVFFWSVSGVNEGEISKAKFSIGKEFPFFEFDNSRLYVEQVRIWDNVVEFLTACKEGPELVHELVKKFEEAAKEMEEVAKNVEADAKAAGLGAIETAKAGMNVGLNLKVVAAQLHKVKKLPELAIHAAKLLQALLVKIKDSHPEFDTYGKKIAAEKMWRPSEIFGKFHPGAKLTKEEYEQRQKEKEQAGGKKKKKTDNKKKDEKKKDEKKPDEKKHDEKKHDEKKPDEKKAETPAPEVKH